MKADEARNTIDSAHPHAKAADRLSEDEKKALELSGLVEHADGKEKSDIAHDAEALDARSDAAAGEH